MYKNKMLKRILSYVLCTMLILGLVPESMLTADAAGITAESVDISENETTESLDISGDETMEEVVSDDIETETVEEEIPEKESEYTAGNVTPVIKLNGVELPNNSYKNVKVKKDASSGTVYSD